MATMQELVEQYVPLANKLAYQKKKSLPKFIDVEDLKSAAYMGLVEAATRYDESKGVAFSTFAYPRIFGEIHDYLRKQGWIKRCDLTPMISLDSACCGEEDCVLKDTIAGKPADNTEECFEVITFNLDHQAKAVLRHYFIDDYSMKEVGEKFGISESRISQLVKRYKLQIQNQWTESDLISELAA